MNILLINLHSAQNLGDDAIMYATLPRLREAFPTASIFMAANDPHSWVKHGQERVVGSLITWVVDRHNGGWKPKKLPSLLYPFVLAAAGLAYRLFKVRITFGSLEQRRLLDAYYTADLVLSCGGGNFYANKARLSFGYVWTLLLLAFPLLMGKRAVMLPQSVGPIPGRLQRWLGRLVFERVARIYVRDTQSQALLRAMGVQQESILMPDLVFSLLPEQLVEHPLKSEDEALQIGVTVIDRGAQYGQFQGQQAYEDAVVAALRHITQHRPARIHVFSQCFGPSPDQDDRPVAERIYARVQAFTGQACLHNDLRDALELQKVYQSMDCMIGSRMHTAILSLVSGVPVVLIGYQPKAQGMMAFFGFEPYVIPIEAVTAERLSQAALEIIERRVELRAVIMHKTREMAQRLAGWEENLLE